MLSPNLISTINKGRCIALIGSGPSCEVGYPSWEKLAILVRDHLVNNGVTIDKNSYTKYLKNRKYPELFRQAEVDLNSRQELINIIQSHINITSKKTGYIYDFLTRWPFSCYLTTNYDDELDIRLSNGGQYYRVIRNRIEDFYCMRDGVTGIIMKLHSDLLHPDEVVITSRDYQKLTSKSDGSYYKDKLRQIMEMFDICIIGHSLSDPDLTLILEAAKETASPNHPIYMIAADFTAADEREYYERFNIVINKYENKDGNHTQLRRYLNIANNYIVQRERQFNSLAPQVAQKETETACSLYIYRQMQTFRIAQGPSSIEFMGPIVLQSLVEMPPSGYSHNDLLQQEPLKSSLSGGIINQHFDEIINCLTQNDLITQSDNHYLITPLGREELLKATSIRKSEEELAFGQFITTIKKSYKNLTTKEESLSISIIKDTLTIVYNKRGIAMANAIFSNQSIGSDDLTNVFAAISKAATALDSYDLRAAFMEAATELIIQPTPPQKKYLSSISQGYFLYHMFGLDPECTKVRKEVFDNTAWIFDSSVLLPLIAYGSHNHEYAKDLFSQLKSLNSTIYTSNKLLRETWDHLFWAIQFMKTHRVDSPEFLMAALLKGGYKQNLFIDGYIRLSAEGAVTCFSDYINLVLPDDQTQKALNSCIENMGIVIIEMDSISGFDPSDWRDVSTYQDDIQRYRESRNIFRSGFQVEAEAEIYQIVKSVREHKYRLPSSDTEQLYFLSQSHVLDRVFRGDVVITWTPEALYRYLMSLPGENLNPELLQQCMLHHYYYAGIDIIDKPRYLSFFGGLVSTAKLTYATEKQRYVDEVPQVHAVSMDEDFDNTPDMEKPFFVMQMSHQFNRTALQREKVALQAAQNAELQVRQLKAEREAGWKKRSAITEQHESARIRNLQDPKHVQKRKRQAKKRLRKST